MSAVDPRFPDLDLFLQGLRHRLNLRFLAGEVLAAAMVSAPASLVPVLVLGQGLGPRAGLWGLLAGGAALAWGAGRIGRRLSLARAAAWFDEDQHTGGLFLAAVETLERADPGPLGFKVLHQADLLRIAFQAGGRFRFPRKRLVWRAVGTVVVAALSWGTLILDPVLPGIQAVTRSATEQPSAPGPSAPPLPPGSPGDPGAATPKALAHRLFPEDSRLAALAEQALVSGDPGALDSLLEQSQARTSRGPGSGQAPGQGKGQGPSGRSPGTAPGGHPVPGTSDGQTGPEGTDAPQAGQGQDQGTSRSDSGGKNPGQGADGAEPPAPGTNSGGRTPGDRGTGPGGAGSEGDSPQGAGGAPGTGHSNRALGNADDLLTSDRRLPLAARQAPGVFEFVLPGSGAKVPLTKSLVDSRQAAESAVDRSSTPLEFQNTIRSYFLSLSQEAQP